MRKADREVKDLSQVEALLMRAEYIQLAFWDGIAPYMTPMSFGYKDRVIYVHGSVAGKRGECLRVYGQVGFGAVAQCETVRRATACGYTSHYQSVTGWGRASLIEDPREKAKALDIIMAHYNGPQGGYDDESLQSVSVLRIEVEELTGKANPPLPE